MADETKGRFAEMVRGIWRHIAIPANRVRWCTLASLLLMSVGHWKIVGQNFDPLTGETFNVFTRWISDFAAKSPEGWWIKASIAMFCVALADFFRLLALREARDTRGVWRGFFILIVGSLMVGGLLLVAVFDLSPRQYQITESRIILDQARAGQDDELATDEPDEADDGIPWWEVLLEPKGSTLREGMLRDELLPEEELKLLRERIVREDWGEKEVLEYLRQKIREQEAAEDDLETAEPPPGSQVRTEKKLRPLPRGSREMSKHWYHRLGFQLFLFGFACGSVMLALMEWRAKAYPRLPGTLLMLSLNALFGIWLLAEKLGLAGIPQRALLILIAVWLLRNLRHACAEPQ